MTKKKLNDDIKALRNKIQSTGLSYRQVYDATGVSKGWFMRMIRGDFHDPNPEWMNWINGFLDDYLGLLEQADRSKA